MAAWSDERSKTTRRAGVWVLVCAQCNTRSGLRAHAWRGYRIDDPNDADDPPALAFFCPGCAAYEFGD